MAIRVGVDHLTVRAPRPSERCTDPLGLAEPATVAPSAIRARSRGQPAGHVLAHPHRGTARAGPTGRTKRGLPSS
jgi:hypothetical protein